MLPVAARPVELPATEQLQPGEGMEVLTEWEDSAARGPLKYQMARE